MDAVKNLQKLVFRILGMILWLAPLGAFGAIASVVGKTGVAAIWSLGVLMIAFYITCFLFIVVILGTLLFAVTRVNIFSLVKYLAREYLLIVGTSSSESALPRLIAKMEHIGVSKPVVGITVPTGYLLQPRRHGHLPDHGLALHRHRNGSADVDRRADRTPGVHDHREQGSRRGHGCGTRDARGGLQAYRPDLVDGVGVIVGIDRFMSEGRALTNFTGNAVATLLIGTWTRQIDRDRVQQVLSGALPFDESLLDGVDDHGMADENKAVDIQGLKESALEEMAAKEERARVRASQG